MAKPKNEITLDADNSREPRNNPEVDKRLNAYIAANQTDHDYYSRLVKENPDRAVRVIMLKDMNRHDSDMRLVEKQLPQAREFYEQQPDDVKQRIDERLAKVNPYYKDKAFVSEVLREMGRQNRKQLTAPPPRAGVSIG